MLYHYYVCVWMWLVTDAVQTWVYLLFVCTVFAYICIAYMQCSMNRSASRLGQLVVNSQAVRRVQWHCNCYSIIQNYKPKVKLLMNTNNLNHRSNFFKLVAGFDLALKSVTAWLICQSWAILVWIPMASLHYAALLLHHWT